MEAGASMVLIVLSLMHLERRNDRSFLISNTSIWNIFGESGCSLIYRPNELLLICGFFTIEPQSKSWHSRLYNRSLQLLNDTALEVFGSEI
jgi:hypothetical protein